MSKADYLIELREDGVYAKDEEGGFAKVAPPISLSLTILPKAESAEASLQLRFTDSGGRSRISSIEPSLRQKPAMFRDRVLNFGYGLPTGKLGKAIIDTLMAADIPATRIGANKVGWHDNEFVLPDETLRPTDATGDPQYIYTGQVERGEHPLSISGTLESWRKGIGLFARSSDLLLFVLCVAFATILMFPLGVKNRIFHLYGPSQSGKSTLLRAAFSVFGHYPGGTLPTWSATKAGIEQGASDQSDMLMVLDELAQQDDASNQRKLVAAIKDAAFKIGNGRIKQRARGPSKALGLPDGEFRVFALSSGEESPETLAAVVGNERLDGEKLRINTIDIAGRSQTGIWNRLPKSAKSHVEAIEKLNMGIDTNHGAVGREFIQFSLDAPDLVERCQAIMDAFYEREKVGADGYARSYAKSYALITAAGILAIEAGCLPVKAWRVEKAVGRIYRNTQQEHPTARKTRKNGLRLLERALRSSRIVDGHNEDASDILGYRRKLRHVGATIAIIPEEFNRLFDSAEQMGLVAATLGRLGLWIPDQGQGGLSHRQVTISGLGARRRYICLSGDTADRIAAELAPKVRASPAKASNSKKAKKAKKPSPKKGKTRIKSGAAVRSKL